MTQVSGGVDQTFRGVRMCLSAGCLQDGRCSVRRLRSAESPPGRGVGPVERPLGDRLAMGAENTATFRDRLRQKFGLRMGSEGGVLVRSHWPKFPRCPLEGQGWERLMTISGQSAMNATDGSISDGIEVSARKRLCMHDKRRHNEKSTRHSLCLAKSFRLAI